MIFITLISLILYSPCHSSFVEEECLNYTVYPLQYDVSITPYVYLNKLSHYDCDLMITLIANAPNVKVIELDAKEMDIDWKSIRVFKGDVNLLENKLYSYDAVSGKIFLYLKEPLLQYSVYHQQYSVFIRFRKVLRKNSDGVFLVEYEDNGPKYAISTRLSPNQAKYFFPCFGNPRFEAVFKFKIIQPDSYHQSLQKCDTDLLIATEEKRDRLKNNVEVIYYRPSPQVALHQVGFHHSQYQAHQITSNKDLLTIWSPSKKLHQYDYLLKFGKEVIEAIHDYSKSNRPLVTEAINIVSLPVMLSGYEIGSWNLLTNSENRLACNNELTSIKQIQRMKMELAQQLCRIWLGNPGELERTRWKEEWFKEGVVIYFANYFLHQMHRANNSRNHLLLALKHSAMNEEQDVALSDMSKSLAVELDTELLSFVSKKTASTLWMVENWVGSEKFHNALVKYINSRRGKYILLQDFLSHLDTDTVECEHQFLNGSTASKVLKSWFEKPGYPVISVQVVGSDIILLTQKQFSFNKHNRFNSNYLIPISYVTQNTKNCYNCFQPRFTIGMQEYSFKENLNGGWIILNSATGYYRVNYDANNWIKIGKTLKENHRNIDEFNRAQIVNDVFALFVSGDLERHLAFKVLDYLNHERSDVVWKAAIEGFKLLKTDGANCNMTKSTYENWQSFMREKISGIYFLLEHISTQNEEKRLTRNLIMGFACRVKYEPCLQRLRNDYKEHLQGRKSFNPDDREAMYHLLSNGSSSHMRMRSSLFEQEDEISVINYIQGESQFLRRIPRGQHINLITELEPISLLPDTSTIPPHTKDVLPNTASLSNAAVTTIIFVISTIIFIR